MLRAHFRVPELFNADVLLEVPLHAASFNSGTMEIVPVQRRNTEPRADLGCVCDLHRKPQKGSERAETADVEQAYRSPSAKNRGGFSGFSAENQS